ncbi:permease [Virgibacillus senegalensis]|uniref:permease n=1 Tax=Virgibacillus senegalensis TaxID=1499679 RepID=UPI000AE8CAF3|nr:permease [Virgibacillus senegalensis]
MLQQIGQSAITSVGFFWKAGWAFVLGYLISSMIQAFIPQGKLAGYIGNANAKSIGLATLFGAISSSCSFAALAAGKSLFKKGAHFIATLAFLFASTNLVIELGILIYIFLGWQFVVAEIFGGMLLIIVASLLARFTMPEKWVETARKRAEEEHQEDFEWRKKIRTKEGWYQVGHEFVMNWKMVWKDITIGFTVAGIMATFVPESFWEKLFLTGSEGGFWVVLENAIIAPLAAALTFIGSMGNIPISTILASSGVTFAGIMAFIYSDLIVPPIVMVNKKYYGWKLALYIAGLFYVSIVITALLIHSGFSMLGILPESGRQIMNASPFQIDYTFWFNIVFAFIALFVLWLFRQFKQSNASAGMMSMEGDSRFKTIVTWVCIAFLALGTILHFVMMV